MSYGANLEQSSRGAHSGGGEGVDKGENPTFRLTCRGFSKLTLVPASSVSSSIFVDWLTRKTRNPVISGSRRTQTISRVCSW